MSFLRAFMEGTREGEESRRRTRPTTAPRGAPVLRPPGAAPGEAFLELCSGSGMCAQVCPAEAIRLVPREDDPTRNAPRILPAEAACVVCEDLSCMKACPSGALTLVPREEIRIGLAWVEPRECLAWAGDDPFCTDCIDHCPMGEAALRLLETSDGRRGPVVESACVGCGVCEHHCPVFPAAIHVQPLSAS